MISYGQITVSGIEDGYNRAVIQLYMRSSASYVNAPTTHPIYTFSNGSLSFVPSGWSLTVPATDGNPCWTTSATVVSQEATCAVESWTTPVKLVEDGLRGGDATAYHLIVSHAAIVKTKTGSYSPASITLSAKSQTGSNAMADYSGRFKIETTANGTSWTQQYPSSGSGTNQSSYTYTIPDNITITAVRCSLYLAGGLTTLLDQQIVPIVTDGTDGAPAYTVILTNESHQFIGDTTHALQASATIGVIAYKGANQIETTVNKNSITGLPASGMSVSVSPNNTPSTSTVITVSVTTGMTSTHGTLTIPVGVDGKTFTKIFTYSLQLAPTPGQKGDKGDAASSVYMNVSAAAVARSELGAYNPTAITMEAMVQTGVSDPLATTGFFKVETSDGTTWIQRYASSTAESFYSYTNLPTGITSIRISLYKESGMTTLYDQRIIPIVNEGYTITAERAVNRATAIYGVCSTTASTAAKVVTISNFEAYNGAQITVLFTHEHQAANPTLNVMSQGQSVVGARPIYATSDAGLLTQLAANTPPTSVEDRGWVANSLVNLLYDETNARWIIVDSSALQKIDNILTKVIAGTYGEINMTNGTFTFTGTNGSIAYSNGNLDMTGRINALAGGTIGGFTIDTSSIRNLATGSVDTGAITLASSGFSRQINGTSRSNLLFAIGGNFGVDNTGVVYASSANISGTINAGQGGSIGGFYIDTTSIRNLATSSYDTGAITLASSGFTRRINETSRANLLLAIGGSFGVTNTGKLYASLVDISGTIDATGGKISGDMTVTGKLKGANIAVQTTDATSTSAGFRVIDSTGATVFDVTPNGPTSTGFMYKTRFNSNLYIDGTAYSTGAFAAPTLKANTVQVTDTLIGSALPTVYATINSNGVYAGGKTSVSDGVTGTALHSNGNIYLTSDSNPNIRFYVNSATSWTQTLTANTNGLVASSSMYATTFYENNVSLADKYAPIPDVKYSVSGSQTIADYSMATGTAWVTIGSFTLDKGLNHVIVSCEFASNATGRRALCIATSNTGNAMSNNARRYVPPANGANTSVVIDMYISPTANNTTYYLRGYQNSGSSLTVTTRLTAVNYG